MAGPLSADVNVTYERGTSGSLPEMPAPIAKATLGEQARFIAMALKYDPDRAKGIADRTPRNQLRGMTASFERQLAKDRKSPDWGRARRVLPEWASQRRAS
jgi:hypothetical protein